MKRTQVPIQPAFAITAHKAQGQTFGAVVLDLAGCTGTEAPYVMLSRATSLQGVIILRPFDKSKITCRPSEDLRKENHRLETLAGAVQGIPNAIGERQTTLSRVQDRLHAEFRRSEMFRKRARNGDAGSGQPSSKRRRID